MKRVTKKPKDQVQVSSPTTSSPSIPTPAVVLPPSSPSSGLLPAAFVFLVVFSVYTYTCYPTVSGGDAGELVVTACNLGTAHPPGYPLFTMLGRLFISLLPFGHKAWRVNMMSVVCASFAALFLYLTAFRITKSVWPGFVAAFGFAFSPTVWLYAIQGEVFGLNNLLCCAMSYLTIIYFEQALSKEKENKMKSLRTACQGAFVCGLALTNQHTTVFYVMITVLAVTLTLLLQKQLNLALVVKLCLCFVLGISPYLYLPISSYFKGVDSWGDMRTFEGFLHHFLRREYGTFQLAADGTSDDPGMVSRLIVYWRVLLSESLYITPFVALAGVISLYASGSRASKLAGLVFSLNYLLYMGVFHYLANLALTPLYLGVQARFWQQANLFIYLWAAVGLYMVVDKLFVRKANKNIGNVLLAILALSYSACQCGFNFDTYNHRDNHVVFVHGQKILNSFPPNSLVLLNGDINNNAIKYPQQCEGIRKDVRLISLQLLTWDWFVDMQAAHYPNVTFPGNKYHPRVPGAFSFKQFLDSNIKKFPIFICGPYKEHDDSWKEHYHDFAFGNCQRIVPKPRTTPPGGFTKFFTAGYKGMASTKELGPWFPKRYTEDTWEHVVYFDVWRRRLVLSSIAAYHANKNLSDVPLLKLAHDIFADVFAEDEIPWLETSGLIFPDAYRGAGIISGQYAKALTDERGPREAIAKLEKNMVSMWKRYLAVKPDDKEIKEIVDARMNPYTGTRW